MNIALLTAGGIGSRMQQEIPKQFLHPAMQPSYLLLPKQFCQSQLHQNDLPI
jgi:2-C-methyl-D-erythritol 4-phosphate cytidylyltransferase